MLDPGITEASDARVFSWKECFFMNLMGNHRRTRKIYRAFSKERRHWQVPRHLGFPRRPDMDKWALALCARS